MIEIDKSRSFFSSHSIIDITDTEAFLVRKSGDTGDVFTVDTTNNDVELGSGVDLVLASTAKIYLDGKGDTYLYESSADVLSAVVGGVEQLTLNTTGNHVWNSTLDAPTGNETAWDFNLTVNKATSGDATGIYINITDTASPGALIPFKISDNSLVVKDGKVGIGTVNPTKKLQVNDGSIRLKESTYGESIFIKKDSSISGIGLSIRDNAESVLIQIKNDGSVGIGTTTFGISAAGEFAIGNGTLGAAAADIVQMAATDYAVGDSRLYLQTELGNKLIFGNNAIETDTGDLALVAGGSNYIKFGTHSALGVETVTGYITIKDSGGTLRKIAVVS